MKKLALKGVSDPYFFTDPDFFYNTDPDPDKKKTFVHSKGLKTNVVKIILLTK